jgi:hypothetical protein
MSPPKCHQFGYGRVKGQGPSSSINLLINLICLTPSLSSISSLLVAPSSALRMKLRVRHDPNNQVPHSLEQQCCVLSKEQIAHLLPALESTAFSEDGDVKDGIASKKWGTLCTAAGQAVHPTVSKIVHHVAANNDFMKTHSVEGRPVLCRVAVVKMDSSPLTSNDLVPASTPHKDGSTSLVTVVCTLYN